MAYAANTMKLELTPATKPRLLEAFLHLAPWPDTVDGLRRLRQSGLRVITLANFSPTMLVSNAENAWMNRFNQPFEELGVRPEQTLILMGCLVSRWATPQ